MEQASADLPPQPEKSGSDLTQEAKTPADGVQLIRTHAGAEGIAAIELSDALNEMREGGVKGQAGMLLLHAHAVRLEREIAQLRTERNEAQRATDQYRSQYEQERVNTAALRTYVASLETNRSLQNALITFGGLLLGSGAQFLRREQVPMRL